jgi:hypothetical protein
MTTQKPIYKMRTGFNLLLIAVLLCSACGAKIIRGASPLVRMTELSQQDNTLSLQLSMRNLNGVDLDIQSIDLRLTVNESEDELFVYNGPVDENIVANGTESWSVEIKESETSRELLNSLEGGDINSLPYTLKGTIISTDDGSLRFEYEGHIYPVPGKPGYFR